MKQEARVTYIVGRLGMTGTSKDVGESRFADVRQPDEAHFEVILHAAETGGAHELGVAVIGALLLVLWWHYVRCG